MQVLIDNYVSKQSSQSSQLFQRETEIIKLKTELNELLMNNQSLKSANAQMQIQLEELNLTQKSRCEQEHGEGRGKGDEQQKDKVNDKVALLETDKLELERLNKNFIQKFKQMESKMQEMEKQYLQTKQSHEQLR